MHQTTDQPAFGQADLSNCERELIHLSGSVQPHGCLLVLSEPSLEVLQASVNVDSLLGIPHGDLLGHPVDRLGGDVAVAIRGLVTDAHLADPQPAWVTLRPAGVPMAATMLVHRPPAGGLIVEFEEVRPADPPRRATPLAPQLTDIVTRIGTAHAIPVLADLIVREMRVLTGYDRVMVYRFDPDGHGEVIAEARKGGLESFLHRHYPATDIPNRARELYLRNKVRLLTDVGYDRVPLEPRLNPATGDELDLSMAMLRSISPIHIQFLKNMGVAATLVASLVHEGRLWGLIACHHYSARYLPYQVRASVELLAEVCSTRISALEHYAEAQAEVLVRRLEQRLIEESASHGDWRRTLFDAPRQLLQPVNATGAALFYDGEVHTTGDVPSTADLRALRDLLDARADDGVFACKSIAKLHPPLASLTPVAAGILAVRLGSTRGEYLVWCRREQLQDVVWGGDPAKPVEFHEGMELSPRRSFAAWREIVRETSVPWTARDSAIAKAIGHSLSDIILQIRAVRVLIAESQLARVRDAVLGADDAVVIADGDGRLLVANDALARFLQGPFRTLESLDDLAGRFESPGNVLQLFDRMRESRRPWRGELKLARPNGPGVPVAMRCDPVPQIDGRLLGFIVILNDLTARHAGERARERLQRAVLAAQQAHDREARSRNPDVARLVAAIWSNAGVAASEIADSADTSAVAPLLQEVEASTRHAERLSEILQRYAEGIADAAS